MTEEESNISSITFVDDEGRARIKKYSQTSKFRIGDTVKIVQANGSRKGPYYIASIPSSGVYTLSDENGAAVEDGDEIEENDLVAA